MKILFRICFVLCYFWINVTLCKLICVSVTKSEIHRKKINTQHIDSKIYYFLLQYNFVFWKLHRPVYVVLKQLCQLEKFNFLKIVSINKINIKLHSNARLTYENFPNIRKVGSACTNMYVKTCIVFVIK